MKRSIVIPILLLIPLFLYTCKKVKIKIADAGYPESIGEIIVTKCAISGCHNGSTSLPDFRSLATVQANSGNIKSFTQTGFMPRNGSLSQNEIDLIACWVDDGALNN